MRIERERTDQYAAPRRAGLIIAIALGCQLAAPAWADQATSTRVSSPDFDISLLPPPPTNTASMAKVATTTPKVEASPVVSPGATGGLRWLTERREPLDPTPSIALYLTNECVLAGVAATAVALLLPTPVGPVASAALGVVNDMSVLGITALGCVAGASAGAVSASLFYAVEEPETIRDFTVQQASNIRDAAYSTAEMIGGAIGQTGSIVQAAAVNVMWAASSVGYGVGGAVTAVAGTTRSTGEYVMAAAKGVGDWWNGAPGDPAPIQNFDVAEIPQALGEPGMAVVY